MCLQLNFAQQESVNGRNIKGRWCVRPGFIKLILDNVNKETSCCFYCDKFEPKVPGFWKCLVAQNLTRIHENRQLSLDLNGE